MSSAVEQMPSAKEDRSANIGPTADFSAMADNPQQYDIT